MHHHEDLHQDVETADPTHFGQLEQQEAGVAVAIAATVAAPVTEAHLTEEQQDAGVAVEVAVAATVAVPVGEAHLAEEQTSETENLKLPVQSARCQHFR